MTFLADIDAWEILDKHPELFLIALVVIVGLINGAARQVKKLVQTGDHTLQDTQRRPDGATRGAAAAPPRQPGFVDPERLLPAFLRPRTWAAATEAGVVTAPQAKPVSAVRVVRQAKPAPPAARLGDAPSTTTAVTPAPRRGRRRRHREHDEGPVHRLLGDSAAAPSPHAPIGLHGLLGRGRPARAAVRVAVLWSEILGPPRALRPYQSVAHANARRAQAPASLGILPLPPAPPAGKK